MEQTVVEVVKQMEEQVAEQAVGKMAEDEAREWKEGNTGNTWVVEIACGKFNFGLRQSVPRVSDFRAHLARVTEATPALSPAEAERAHAPLPF